MPGNTGPSVSVVDFVNVGGSGEGSTDDKVTCSDNPCGEGGNCIDYMD